MSELDDYISLFSTVLSGNNMEYRVASTEIDGLEVSTVKVIDLDCFETAILDATSRAYPVERYDTEEAAREGHDRWVEKVPGLKSVTQLGFGVSIPEEEKELHR